MRKLITIIAVIFWHTLAIAQLTTTSATITDSDTTVWTNAQVSVSFQPNPNFPNINVYNIAGVPILGTSGPNYAQYLQQNVMTNGSGAFSLTLLNNQLISPSGSSWHFVIRPNASVQAISYNPIAVSGSTFSLTTYLSTNSIAPRLPALPGSYAYSDVEIQPIPSVGGFYFNTTATIQIIWNGTGWQNGAGGGGTIPATNNVLKGSGSTGIAVPASHPADYLAIGDIATYAQQFDHVGTHCSTGNAPIGIDAQGDSVNCQPISPGSTIPVTILPLCGTNVAGVSAACPIGGSFPGLTPAAFGGWGDAREVVNGCNTTASNTTVTCASGNFVSGDAGIGKEIWISGAGISGGALGSVIATVVNSTTITISPSAATATVTGAYSVVGHDDVLAMQSCFNYSAANRIPCYLNSPTGYLIANGNSGLGLQMAVTPVSFNGAMNVQGNSQTKGTVLYSFIDGDFLSLQAGPVQGAVMSNIEIREDPSQPNSRGIHLNATPAPGSSSNPGGLFNSTFFNVQVDNPAKECMWMEGGGGPGYAFNLPNQYVNSWNFTCNGPNQLHTANLILLTGQDAQINFFGGAVNGDDTIALSNYPNPLIAIHEKTGGSNDSPMAVEMLGWTYEVGTQGLYISNSDTIHYDNGYIERIGTPYIVTNSTGITLDGNHVANGGFITAVASFPLQSTVSMRNNHIFSDGTGPHTIVALAVCQNDSNNIDFTGTTSENMTTTNCATAQIGSHTSTLTVIGGNTEFVNGSATTITTINAPHVTPGKTLTLYSASSPGITLGTGGNINLSGLTSPVTVPSGHSITLTLFDLGPVWLVTAVN